MSLDQNKTYTFYLICTGKINSIPSKTKLIFVINMSHHIYFDSIIGFFFYKIMSTIKLYMSKDILLTHFKGQIHINTYGFRK